jgi:phage/plasmid-associated DNA primase
MRDFKNVHFRAAYPDDLITLQMAAEYHPEIYSWEHPDVQYVMEFKRKILTEEEIREFSLTHKGSCLMGGNKEKYNIINIGESAHNGKSTDASFDRQTFGTYSGKLPLGAVSGATPKMNEVNPFLVNTKGTRIQQIDEASKKQEFNAAFMKLAAGNDEQSGRKLYSDGVTFLPQFNLIMYCNSAPTRLESAGDAGMDERDVLIPHNSRFTKNAPESIEEQWRQKVFKADPHIKVALKARIDAHLWILVEYLKKYLEFGLKKPQGVIDKTDNYHRANNPYKQFISEKLENTSRQVDFVALQDLYAHYKLWFADCFPGKKLENKEDFSSEITKYLGPYVGDDRRFHSYKIKTEIKRFERNAK